MGKEYPNIVFLDRDGTINVDTGYLCDPAGLELLEGAADAIAALKQHGFRVYVVTNQSAVGRGLCRQEQVDATNDELRKALRMECRDAVLDGIFLCPHAPEDDCDCRKPKTGMVESLHDEVGILPDRCWIVGDKGSDLEFGANLEIPFEQRVLVLTGSGISELSRIEGDGKESPVYRNNLAAAAVHILEIAKRIS